MPKMELTSTACALLKSSESGHIYELDGDGKGQLDHGALGSDEDVASSDGLDVIQRFISKENGTNVNFSLLALVSA